MMGRSAPERKKILAAQAACVILGHQWKKWILVKGKDHEIRKIHRVCGTCKLKQTTASYVKGTGWVPNSPHPKSALRPRENAIIVEKKHQ